MEKQLTGQPHSHSGLEPDGLREELSLTQASASEVRRSEVELRDFVQRAPVAMHCIGEDGTILWANDAELSLLGYTSEEYVGRNIVEFHLDQFVIVDILARLKRGEDVREYDARLRGKNGTAHDVSVNSIIYRENGRFVHARCITLDATERGRVAEIHERLAAIVESSDDAIISKDLRGIITSWNRGAERIFGYTQADIIGRHVSVLAARDHVDEIPDILARIARGERVDHYETKRCTKDGRTLTVSLTVSPIRDGRGNIIGASKVARDNTERAEQELALREANDALTRSNADLQQFAHSASHDLQEPLRLVAIYSEMLRRDFGEKLGPTGDRYIQHTINGARRMEQLLKDLRAYTQASTEDQLPLGEIDANQSLDGVLDNLAAAIRESGATIIRSALPAIRIHAFQIDQLFQNLIANAVRYRSAEPLIVQIDAVRSGGNWLFSVQDNGIGIDPQYKEQIFGIFTRLHTNAEYPGTGMGLAICERIIQRSGGRIWVESAPGKGSTFFFTIPG